MFISMFYVWFLVCVVCCVCFVCVLRVAYVWRLFSPSWFIFALLHFIFSFQHLRRFGIGKESRQGQGLGLGLIFGVRGHHCGLVHWRRFAKAESGSPVYLTELN